MSETPRHAARDYIAVIDIGSNAVRLVVYDGINRAPFRIHNERVVCHLGADLSTTGRLGSAAVERAFAAIGRFSGLLSAMRVEHVRAVATAAIRDAADGADFIARVQKDFGLAIDVIDGDEEARLSALGVLGNGTDGAGVIGDYGGGSLELIVFEDHRIRHKASLPIGSLRLFAEKDIHEAEKTVGAHLDGVAFLNDCAHLDFYALGGAWRSMAKAHMHMSAYPIRLIDHYTITGTAALSFAGLIAREDPASLERMAGLSKRRIRDLSVAAIAMEALFKKITPKRMIFSATGLREGLIFDQLAEPARGQDALIASCAKIALKISRFDDLRGFHTLFRWLQPLFPNADADVLKLLEASCLLSDTGWFEGEDYQAEHAFARILVLPLYGVDHSGRAFLALSQYMHYKGYLRRGGKGADVKDVTRPAQKILDSKTVDRAVIAGLAQRLAYLLTGGALALLKRTALTLDDKNLTLTFLEGGGSLNAEVVDDALKALAEAMRRQAQIKG